MNDHKPLELEECPDCRGTGALCHEGGWCVYVECLDCGAHTAYVEYANPEEQAEAERRSAALWNMGKVIHMRPSPGPARLAPGLADPRGTAHPRRTTRELLCGLSER